MNCKESQGHFKPSLATFYPFELVSDFSYLSLNFYLCKKKDDHKYYTGLL